MRCSGDSKIQTIKRLKKLILMMNFGLILIDCLLGNPFCLESFLCVKWSGWVFFVDGFVLNLCLVCFFVEGSWWVCCIIDLDFIERSEICVI